MLPRLLSVLLAGLMLTSYVLADSWPQFRGPAGTGSTTGKLPLQWGNDRNVAWKVELPGVGWSSPVVVGDRVFITTAVTDKQPKAKGFTEGTRDLRSMIPFGATPPNVEYRWEILCLERSTGKQLWRQTVVRKKPDIPVHPSNTFATESPVTDGRHVCALFGPAGVLCCLDRDGKELWRREFEPAPMTAGFGTGSSLALADGRVFVQRDNEKKSFLLALDIRTGKQLWRVDRDSKSSWSTPLLWRNAQRAELVVGGTGKLISYDPASGKELWRLTGIPATFTASPTADTERIYFGTSSPTTAGKLYAVKAGASGDITPTSEDTSSSFVAWTINGTSPGMPSPVVKDGLLYLAGSGFLTCIDGKTGERVYRSRLAKTRSIAASLWIVGDLLYVLDEDGTTQVFKTGPKFEPVARNQVEGLFWATPAVAGNELFLRSADRLYCIRE